MTKQDKIHLFEQSKVRTLWDDESERWYLTDVADTEQLFRLIQSIPSPKAGDKLSPSLM